MKYSDVLFHVDSIGVRPSATVIGLGFVPFNIESLLDIGDPTYVSVLSGSYQQHRTADEESLAWWSHDAPYPAPLGSTPPGNALEHLFVRVLDYQPQRIWFWTMHASAIMHSLLDDTELVPPWEYHQLREARTFCNTVYRLIHGHVMPTPHGDSPEHQLERRAAAIQECTAVLIDKFRPVPEILNEWS